MLNNQQQFLHSPSQENLPNRKVGMAALEKTLRSQFHGHRCHCSHVNKRLYEMLINDCCDAKCV